MATVRKHSLNSKQAKSNFKAPNNRHHKQFKSKGSKVDESLLNGQGTTSEEAATVQAFQN